MDVSPLLDGNAQYWAGHALRALQLLQIEVDNQAIARHSSGLVRRVEANRKRQDRERTAQP